MSKASQEIFGKCVQQDDNESNLSKQGNLESVRKEKVQGDTKFLASNSRFMRVGAQ